MDGKHQLRIGELIALLGSENGLSSNSRIGVELLDRSTCQRKCYIVNEAWANKEWDELTLTIEVDCLEDEVKYI